MNFSDGDHVYVKIKPRNSSLRLGKSSKLSPCYCGPFEVLARVGPMPYQLALPFHMEICNVFHVSLLKKYVPDIMHVVNWNVIQVEPEGEF